MDQTIGISFKVYGVDQIASDFRKVEGHLSQLESKLGGLGKLRELGTLFANVARGSSHLSRAVADIDNVFKSLNQATHQAQQLSASLSKVGRMPRMAPMAGPGVGTGGRAGSQRGLSPYSFMGRWWTAYAGAGALSNFGKETLLGGARESMIDPLRDLANVHMDKSMRKATEAAGFDFLKQYFAGGGIESYLSGAAEVGSALDVGKIGVKQLNALTQQGQLLGMGIQMSGAEATKLLMGTIHAQLAQMPADISQAYLSGKADFSALGDKTGGQIFKIIQDATLWGKDVQNALAYALPTALGKGWKMEQLLGIVGAMVTSGDKAPKVGRFLKAFVEGETGKHAKMQIASDPKLWAEYQELPGKAQKEVLSQITNKFDKWLGNDPFGYMRHVGKLAEIVEKRGMNLVQSMGLSKEWVGSTRKLTKPALIANAENLSTSVGKSTNLNELKANLADVQGDSGYWGRRYGNAWKDLKSGMAAKTPIGGVLDANLSVLQDIADWNRQGGNPNYIPALGTGKDFLLHGLVGGVAQFNSDVYTDIGKALGLVSPDTQAPQFENLVNTITSIPSKLSGFVSGINKPIADVSSALSSAIDSIQGIAGRFDAATGLTDKLNYISSALGLSGPQPAVAAATPGGNVGPDMIVSHHQGDYSGTTPLPTQQAPQDVGMLPSHGNGNMPPALDTPAPVEQQAPPVTVDNHVKVMVGERELQDIVIEAVEDHVTRLRNSWGDHTW